jgi:aryl-alcohol dehydrogenase-like predicted oxidoreductase
LARLLASKAVSNILIGVSKISQLDDNVGALSVTLTPEELALLDAATERMLDTKLAETSGLS